MTPDPRLPPPLSMPRRAVYTSPFVPAEWIAAHGLSPLRLVPDRPPVVRSGRVLPLRRRLRRRRAAPGARGLRGLRMRSS